MSAIKASTVATGNSTYNLTFAYDRYGNMTCQTNAQTQGLCPNYSFNSATNQINTSGFQYDAAGNLIADGSYTYQYDAEGHLTGVDNGSASSLAYNALGQEAETLFSGYQLQFQYDPQGRQVGTYSAGEGRWWNGNVLLGDRVITRTWGWSFEHPNAQRIGILVSDTMMFERGDTHPSDPNLGSFYGLALPLLMKGLPVEPVQMEYATQDRFLDPCRVLLLTYEGQKPPSASFHQALAKWVRAGGALVVIDDDHDPYNSVREWWNTASKKYPTPRCHLFEILGLDAKAAGVHVAGKGAVVWEPLSPAALSYKPDGAHQVIRLVLSAANAIHFAWKESRTLVLRRGPYVIGAGLEEPGSDTAAPPLRGRFIDLFDSGLPILEEVVLTPGRRVFLLDVGKYQKPRVLAAACRITEETAGQNMLRFRAEGIEGTGAVARVALPGAPGQVLVNGKQLPQSDIDQTEMPFKIRFASSAAGKIIEINYRKG